MSHAPFLRKISYTDDNGDSFEVISFPHSSGGVREITISSHEILDPKKIHKKMVNKGLNHITYPPDSSELLDAINAEPLQRCVKINSFGWVGTDFETFVSAAGVAGRACSHDGRSWLIDDGLKDYISERRARSDIADWFDGCAISCYSSSASTIALAAAFAAPLLTVISEPAFGITFYGGQKVERDAIALLAGSVCGITSQVQVPNMPHSGLNWEDLQVRYGDQLVPVRDGNFGDSRETLALTSRFVNFYGGETAEMKRRKRWGRVFGRYSMVPRSIAAIITELSYTQMEAVFASISNSARNPRIISVPIVDENGQFFDRSARAQSSHSASRAIQKIGRSIDRQTSVPIHEFVKFLVENRENLRQRVEELVGEFEAAAHKSDYEDNMFSSSRCFGLLYAASILAGEAQLLLQDPEAEGREATLALFVEAHRKNLVRRGVPRRPEEDLLVALKELEKVYRLIHYSPGDDLYTYMSNYNGIGYWIVKGKWRIYTIHQSSLRTTLGDRRLRRILQFLAGRNLITTGVKPTGDIINDASSTPRWHGKQILKVRSYVFKVPAKLMDSA